MKKQKNFKSQRGITLVALIITIIVLVILAAVAINVALNTGIISFASKGVKDYAEAGVEENRVMNKAIDFMESTTKKIEGILGGNGGTGGAGSGGGSSSSEPNPPSTTKPTIKDAIAQGDTFAQNENKEVVDEFGNPLTIPAGFHIVTHEEDNTVVYDYSVTNPGTPTVQDGIVVEDGDENQFVWIPIETEENPIKDKEGDDNSKDTPIILGRYKFDVTSSYNTIPTGTGKATLKQSADQYEDANNEAYRIYHDGYSYADSGSYYYYEPTTSEKGNTTALNLSKFIESAKKNGGYYLARYEAGYGDNDKPVSKPGAVWTDISQQNAATAAQNMYKGNSNYTSDLVNSYAWDTAIVFIQKYKDEDYSKQNSKNTGSSPYNTGSTGDKVCNIYDMASNCYEWTTETFTYSDEPGVFRGGCYDGSSDYASYRCGDSPDHSEFTFSFRPQLYIGSTEG